MLKGLVFRLLFLGMLLAALFSLYQAWQARSRAAVIVEWTTASELDTAGFNLYRRENTGGQETLVNPNLIPAANDPLTGGSYRYADAGAQPGHTYVYILEEVETSGNRNRVAEIEVQSRQGGVVELILAGLLVVLSGAGLVMSLRQKAERGVEP